jgi:uncharacterized membrane protein
MPTSPKSARDDVTEIKKLLRSFDKRLKAVEERVGLSEPEPEPEKEKPKTKGQGFEERVGFKWLARIGIVCLVIGVGFFLKYAFDNNWIGHLGRVIIGVLAGLVCIVTGEVFDRREDYRKLARILTGGGFAIIYFAIYAAYHFTTYRTAIGISQTLDLVLLTVVVLLAVVFSLRYNSQTILGSAFFLGYLTAFLSKDIETYTLMYCLLLTIGVALVCAYKKWGPIATGGVVATYIVFMVWFFNQNMQNLMVALYFLSAYFVIFTVASFWFRNRDNQELETWGIIVSLVNSFFFYGLFLYWVHDNYPSYKGLFTLALGMLYLLLAYASSAMQQNKLTVSHIVLCVLYLTLTVPLQLDNQLVTIIWALEGVALIYLALRNDFVPLRYLGYAIGIVVVFKTLFIDSWRLEAFDAGDIFGSTRLMAYLVSIIALYVSAILLGRYEKQLPQWERGWEKFYYFGMLVLITVLIALEMNTYWISVGWAIEAIILIFIGFAWKSKTRRILGIVLFGITLLKVVLLDMSRFDTGYRIISFIGLGMILLGASFLYAKYKHVMIGNE